MLTNIKLHLNYQSLD